VALPEHVRWLSKPSLVKPTIVTAFTGWNDAADAASTAMRGLVEGWGAHRLAEIDPEPFTDFATIRPQVRLDDLSRRTIVWPTVGLWHVPTPGGDVILVLGPEPSLRWRLFTEQLIGVARHFDAPLVVTLGALLADVPHSRPAQIIGTASDQDVIDRYDLQRSRYEGPIGIVGVLHDRGNPLRVALGRRTRLRLTSAITKGGSGAHPTPRRPCRRPRPPVSDHRAGAPVRGAGRFHRHRRR
jgi:proteasome assembly chaperone (PAC2) family protein